MRLIGSDPDVKTLIDRIKNSEIELQPSFQRQEVWPEGKRQKLVDSILRTWHIPPIHVIEEANGSISVLDGQQRLAAIRDFVADEFPVDGEIEPFDPKIYKLDGRYFSQLPLPLRHKFLRFPLRLFTIVDYKSAEPAELFYRLNQPTPLTPAEQRNAFFGVARQQVKELVELALPEHTKSGAFGFSNARMAYDDVITRALFLLDARTLREKITSVRLADKFRSDKPFSARSLSLASFAIKVLLQAQNLDKEGLTLNKATAQTWLVFLGTLRKGLTAAQVGPLVEFARQFDAMIYTDDRPLLGSAANNMFGLRVHRMAVSAYENRSTSRVADISSVVVRDLVLWMYFFAFCDRQKVGVANLSRAQLRLRKILRGGLDDVRKLDDFAEAIKWGAEL